MLVWMDETDLDPSKTFYIKHNTNNTRARIDEIEYRVDVNTLKREKKNKFELNDNGRVVITTNKPLFFDSYRRNRNTGSFVLIDPITHNTSAVGMILDKRASDKLPSRITDMDRGKIINVKVGLNRREQPFGLPAYMVPGKTILHILLRKSSLTVEHQSFCLTAALFEVDYQGN